MIFRSLRSHWVLTNRSFIKEPVPLNVCLWNFTESVQQYHGDGSWTGPASALNSIKALTQTDNYRDPTFKQHVNTAIARYASS